jgi:hypothetical protein
MPTFNPEGMTLGAVGRSLVAVAGVGLLTIAFGVFRLRGIYAVPVKDPYLADSLRYRQP